MRRATWLTSFLWILFLASTVGSPPADAYIVDCITVSVDAERAVCGSVALRSLDAQLDHILKADLATIEQYSALRLRLSEFVKSCGSDISCLVSFYEAKIFQKSPPNIDLGLVKCQEEIVLDNCFGTYLWQSGQEYSGQWQDNRRHGLGRQIYSNGDIVIGFWNRDELHGEVKIRFSSGKTYYGKIKHGRYVGPAAIYDNGLRYTGVFTSDDRSQIFKGRQYFFDGTSVFTDFINLLDPLDASLAKEGDHIAVPKSKNVNPSDAFVFLLLILAL